MISFAITAASIAIVTLVVGFGLFLNDYRGAAAERVDREAIARVAQDNHDRWQNALASGKISCKAEIASATALARQEAALAAADRALKAVPVDKTGVCGLDSPIRWDGK